MSLLDALLLDAEPLDVWMAVRTDGVNGSGTEDDPLNGSTRNTPTISVSSINYSGPTATAVTAAAHGFQTGQLVMIEGAEGANAKYYNGTSAIFDVTANGFKYTMWGTPTAAAVGTLTCRLDPYQFDAVMRAQPATPPVAVRLGPGIFETRGHTPQASATSWMVRSGMKLLGSGMEVTVVKLVGARIDDNPNDYIAITGPSDPHPSSFEASDFTVDCNVGGQPSASVACGALAISGSHNRLRRIRIINFGTQTPAAECFALSAVESTPSDQAVDCSVVDCIAEQPGMNDARETSVLCMVFAEWEDGRMGYHRACVIRNCYVNCEYREDPVPIASITLSGGIATVTTRLPHGRSNNAWVRISGAVVNGSTNNSFNGAYQIANVTTYGFTYTPSPDPAANQPTGDMWVGKFPSLLVQITGFSKSGDLGGGRYRVTLTTLLPHFRVPGSTVGVGGIIDASNPDEYSAVYNGVFEVVEVTGAYTLKYEIISASPPPDVTQNGLINAFIGPDFHALNGDGGTATVVEGNRAVNCTAGGPYHDTYNSMDQVTRNNYYRATIGPFQGLAAVSPVRFATSLQAALVDGMYVATGTCASEHKLSVGEIAYISEASLPAYNGFFVITTPPPTPTTFKYTLGLSDPGGSSSGYVARAWGGGRAVVENNIIELFPAQARYFPPRGVLAGWLALVPNAIRVPQAVMRRNVILHADGLPDPDELANLSMGIYVEAGGALMVEENVVDLAITEPPIGYKDVRTPHFFANLSAATTLIQGTDLQTGVQAAELSTLVDEALGLAL